MVGRHRLGRPDRRVRRSVAGRPSVSDAAHPRLANGLPSAAYDHRVTNQTTGADYRAGPARRVVQRVLTPEMRRRMWLRLTRGRRLTDLYLWLDPRFRPQRVTRKTDLVIDGMARSANSY